MQRGFIVWIVLVIIAVLVISYFGFDLAGLLKDPTTQGNFEAVWSFFADLWTNYFKTPAQFVWENIIVGFIWEDVLKPLIFDRENPDTVIPENLPTATN